MFFVNREGLKGNAMVGGCLGHGDHEMIKFIWVPWESVFEGLGVHECWSVFRKYFLEPWEQANSLCLKSSNWGRRPAWLNRELLMDLRSKTKLHDLWKWSWTSWEDNTTVFVWYIQNCVWYIQGADMKGRRSVRVETGQCCVRQEELFIVC